MWAESWRGCACPEKCLTERFGSMRVRAGEWERVKVMMKRRSRHDRASLLRVIEVELPVDRKPRWLLRTEAADGGFREGKGVSIVFVSVSVAGRQMLHRAYRR